jgi:hypothetical protein
LANKLRSSLLTDSQILNHLKEWENLLKNAFKRYKLFLLNQANKNNKVIFKPRNIEIKASDLNITSYRAVVENTLNDIFLMIYRYDIFDSDREFKGIDKNKVAGSFLYHFLKEMPLSNSSRGCNILVAFKILSEIEDNQKIKLFNYESSNIKELYFFLENRLTTAENLYFILKSL